MNYKIVAKSILGNRDEQQDALSVFKCGNLICAVVCDGMGGMKHGSVASQSTVELFEKLVNEYTKSGIEKSIPDFLLDSVDTLDENVVNITNSIIDDCGAGTTIVACVINGDDLYWISIGDSRLYIIRNGEMVQATRDHNLKYTLEQLKEQDEITQDEYERKKQDAEKLTSYVGMGGIDFYDICQTPFHMISGDRLLLTSDGLYKSLAEHEILCAMKIDDINDLPQLLIENIEKAANMYQDNTSFIIIEAEE